MPDEARSVFGATSRWQLYSHVGAEGRDGASAAPPTWSGLSPAATERGLRAERRLSVFEPTGD